MTPSERARRLLLARREELLAGGVALAVLCAFSGSMLLRQSQAPHFVHQAAGWLLGRLAIPGEPPNLNDWVRLGDRWYSSFPPFPAVLMLPFVALHGVAFNDVFFTACIGALDVSLFVAVLRALRERGLHARPPREWLVLAVSWAFGSVFLSSAIRGEVWFTAHVVGVGLTLGYVLASLEARAPVLAGLLFGCAALTRANLAFAFPFFLLQAIAPAGGLPPLRELPGRLWAARRPLVLFGLAGGLVLAGQFLLNFGMFGRLGEFGHAMLHNNRVNERIREWGLFHPHYLAGNLRSAFLLLPQVQLSPPRLGFDGNGMSVFVTTPLLLLLAFPRVRSPLAPALWLTTVAAALPGFLYMNNGWYQFGYRFANDYLPYLFLLLAVGARPIDRTFLALAAAGIAVCTWGAIVFGR
jgi:hypothetical protein